jgi:hypothetical protein
MARWYDTLKSRRTRAAIAVLAYAFAVAVTFYTSRHPYAAFSAIVLAVVWNIYLFWPEIRLLRLTYPRNTQLESPVWLYLFGAAALGLVAYGGWRLYQLQTHSPAALAAEGFAEQYIQGKYLRIADLADADNVIEGRTFEDCHIYGPAVLFLLSYNDVGDSTFEGNMNHVFLPAAPGAMVGATGGVIGLKDCKFRRCRFQHITIVGSPEDIQKWRKEVRPVNP